ncbi:ATP-dependent DNA helicase RecG [Patescibacteria group bacterium]|nr:ATP-dependent DNA helicase RecG [Patescibacteria group bacterium]
MFRTLETPIKSINKIAEKLAPKFKKLGLETIQDLLFYYPYRYDDYSHLLKIQDLQPGVLSTIRVKIELIESRRSFHKKMILTESVVVDETGRLKIVWFNQRFIIKMLSAGDEIYISGKPILTEAGLEFHNPNFEKIGKYDKATMHTNRLVPIYSSTEKLSQKQIRFILKSVLPISQQISEWLPQEIIEKEKLFKLQQAIHQIHFPIDKENLKHARRRLKFDEIFLLQMRAGLIKKELLKFQAQTIQFHEKETKKFVDNLTFEMTLAQKKSSWEIIQDLNKNQPMNRLLEGDVGSGKTITAALSILNVLLNNHSGLTHDFSRGLQVAYMAPTEILAHQHFNSFCKIFKDYDFNIALLTRSESKINSQENIKKTDLIKKIKNQEIDFIIGTHALIQDKIEFKNLALVIIDEQHRFGVQQRKLLKNKNLSAGAIKGGQGAQADKMPHLLSMTATPIPRSLALTLYGELDLSVIDQMPKNRKPIKTKIIGPDQRAQAYTFIRSEIAKDRQVFVVCPLIDPSDKLGAKAVKEEFEKLDKKIFPKIKIELLHGKLKTDEKEKIMKNFVDNKTKILVSTTVIEVGIDVPNASIMLIESAERFGLAQLHQLRGRVGRDKHQSYCFLFTESDNENVFKRLHAVVESKNGFELAEKDLEFRGPGEVYGIKQSGYNDMLKIATLMDWPIIKSTKPWVDKILNSDPELKNNLIIKNKLTDFETSIHFE